MEKLRTLTKKIEHHMTASQIMIFGFAAVILVGSVLLALPICNMDGKWLNYPDALFTSTTAVCVTGLVTIVPATQFTFLGKLVLLLLIQVGGLGIIAITMGAFLILNKQISLRSRIMIQDAYNLNTLSGLVKMMLYILRGTFLVEGVGAILYAFQFVPEFGLLRGIWYSIFHSISAFCNAGIDILGETSLEVYRTNPHVNLVTVALIIVSGIGFTVWQDLTMAWKRIIRRQMHWKRALERMKLHTKLAVTMTAILILGGTVAVFWLEYSNEATLGSLSFGEKWLAALFQSVTTRTAGFFTIPQALFTEQTQLLSCALMFIGGSPGGTAGGVKTTTIAILLMTCWSVLKGSEDTVCFRRKVLAVNIRTGFSVFTVAFLAILIGTTAIISLEQVPLIDALYEVASAVGTVGLTTGLTPSLSLAGKLIIILLMYIGRIGPVTMALLFAGKIGKKKNSIHYPEERIMVG